MRRMGITNPAVVAPIQLRHLQTSGVPLPGGRALEQEIEKGGPHRPLSRLNTNKAALGLCVWGGGVMGGVTRCVCV